MGPIDITKVPPRSARAELDGIAYVPRAIDKIRAKIRCATLPFDVPAPEEILTTDDNRRATFENYLNAFFVTSPTERGRLMRANVAEDVAFSSPGEAGRGLDNLPAISTGLSNGFEAADSKSTYSGNSMGRRSRSRPISTRTVRSSSPERAMRGSGTTGASRTLLDFGTADRLG